MVLAVIALVAAVAVALLVFLKIPDDKMIQLYAIIAVIVVALAAALVAFLSKRKNSIVIGIAIASILVSAGALALFFLESDEDKITHRINTFVAAANDRDLNRMIDCFDSMTRSTLGFVTGFSNSLFGEIAGLGLDTDELFEMAFGHGLFPDDYFYELEVVVEHVEFIGDTRAYVEVTIYVGNDYEFFEFPMVKEDFDWYIDVAGYFIDEFGGLW